MTDAPLVGRSAAEDQMTSAVTRSGAPVGGSVGGSTGRSGYPGGATAEPATSPRPPLSSPARGGASPAARPGTRRARLAVKRVDPWSVLKFSFAFSIAVLVIWIVAAVLLYGVLAKMGVFDQIDSVLADFTTKNGVAEWQLHLSASRVVGYAALFGGINALLFTALGTLGAFMYNLCAALSGGLEVTLTERD